MGSTLKGKNLLSNIYKNSLLCFRADSFLLSRIHFQKGTDLHKSKQEIQNLSPLLNMVVNLSSVSSTLNPCPAEPRYYPVFTNSVDPDQLASEEAN